jgi:protein-S-isoprenylcysteine O-methyltransferase Ste14
MSDLILFAVGSVVGGLSLWWWTGRSASPSRLYRLLAFELLLVLALLTRQRWLAPTLAAPQIIAWVFWAAALGLALPALFRRPADLADGDLAAEIDETPLSLPPRQGIYKVVRHPFYAAALLAGWGFFSQSLAIFDNAALLYAFLLTGASLFLVSAARADEAAAYLRYGAAYALYLKSSKMLIPFVW